MRSPDPSGHDESIARQTRLIDGGTENRMGSARPPGQWTWPTGNVPFSLPPVFLHPRAAGAPSSVSRSYSFLQL